MEWAVGALMKFQCCPVGVRNCRTAYLIKREGVESNIEIQETTILKRKMILNTQGCFVQITPALGSLSIFIGCPNEFITRTRDNAIFCSRDQFDPGILLLKYHPLPELSSHLLPGLL